MSPSTPGRRTPNGPSKPSRREPAAFQRSALAPSLLAAIVLFLAPFLLDGPWAMAVLYATSVAALIIAWFAVQARQWWWPPPLVVIAVIWNPVYPLGLAGPWWLAAQPAAALVLLTAGVLIKTRRTPAPK